MSVHGYKVNNKELQKLVDRITHNEVQKWKKAGLKYAEEVNRIAIEDFYATDNASINRPHTYSAMYNAIKVDKNPRISQDRKSVYITIKNYVDMGSYAGDTYNYQIHNWVNRHKKEYKGISQEWATEFVFNLQWDGGIIGLPTNVPNSQRIGKYSLYEMIDRTYDYKWSKADGRTWWRYLK